MKKFRITWLVFVTLTVMLFTGYRLYEHFKMDSSGPVISGGQDAIKVSIHDGDDVLLQGITAEDKKDGDVTDSLIVEKLSNFYDDNKRIVTYAAFDSDNHISKVERELTYTDYTGTRFALNGSLRFRAGETLNIEKIVKAEDCLDGDLSNKIKIHMETNINNRVIGFYQVDYSVTNSAGDVTTLPIEIEIYEPVSNEVELNLDRYLVYCSGEEPDYTDYLKSIRKGNLEYAFEGVELLETEQPAETPEEAETGEEGEEPQSYTVSKSLVRIESSVDLDVPGVYPVYYHYSKDQGNYTSAATEVLYVVVE